MVACYFNGVRLAIRSHFLLKRARCFSRSRGFLVVLSNCLQPSFEVSHLVSWHVRVMERMCQYLFYLPALRIWVLLKALFLTSKGQDTVPVRWGRKSTKCSYKLRSCRYSFRACPDSKIASKRFPRQWPRAASVTTLDTNATSVSSGSGSQRSWNILGHSDGSTASGSLGSHGPGSSDDNRNTRRRLDTFSSPEDEQSRSAVLLRSPCEQHHKGITKWIDTLWEESNMPACNKPVRTHCKAGSVSVRLAFETRAKCQDFVARYQDDGIPYEIDSPFCCTNTNIIVRQSKSIEDREVGKQFAPFWRELADQLKVLFPDGDDEGAFIIPALDARSHVLSIKD